MNNPHHLLTSLFRGRFDRSLRIEIPYHGSCPNCHHFHVGYLIAYDATRHTRVQCERCGHQIFGLGRSNTQYTLASVNTGTSVIPRGCVEAPLAPAESHNDVVTGSPLAEEWRPITERNSPGQSGPESNPQETHSPPINNNDVDDNLSPPNPRSHHSPSFSEAVGGSQQLQWQQSEVSNGEHPNNMRGWFRGRLHPRSRGLNISRTGLRALTRHLPNATRRSRRHIEPRPHPGVNSPAPHTGADDTPLDASVLLTSQDPAVLTSRIEESNPPARPEVPRTKNHGSQQAQSKILIQRNVDERDMRLRAIRDEKTKQRESEARSQCWCTRECFCKRQGSRVSDRAVVGTGSHAPSDEAQPTPLTDVPDYIFGQQTSSESSGSSPAPINPELSLSYIGGHFDADQRPPSRGEESSSGADSWHVPKSFSRTPTLYTNGSSTSLQNRYSSAPTRPPSVSFAPLSVTPRSSVRVGAVTRSYNTNQPSQVPVHEGLARVLDSIRDADASPAVNNVASSQDNRPTAMNRYESPPPNSASNADSHDRLRERYIVPGITLPPDGSTSYNPTLEEESGEVTPTQQSSNQ